jgi:hypothetical protein
MRNSLRVAIAITLGAAMLAPSAHADWRKDYDRGLKAVQSGQWAEAESAFRAALADDGAPSARKRFQGVVVKVYVPHHYAGLAAYRQGNCQRALEYWNNAASAAVVAGQAELDGVQSRGIADCNQKLAAVGKPLGPTPPVAGTTVPATTTPAVSTQPAKPPVAQPPVAVIPPPATTTQKPPIEPAKPSVVAPVSTPPPAALVAAVEGFLAGRYAAVVQLDPKGLADGRAKALGFQLRAASRHTLAQLADGDEVGLEQARQDVRAARAANANLTPDETLFSPRFRAFWRQTR